MLDISPNLFWPHGARNHQNDPQRNKNTPKWLILGLGVLTYGIVQTKTQYIEVIKLIHNPSPKSLPSGTISIDDVIVWRHVYFSCLWSMATYLSI